MKRIFFTLTLCLGMLTAMAADMPKQGFGFQIGYAQPTLRLNDPLLGKSDSLINTTQLHGLKIGMVYDCSYWRGLGSSIGINYTFAANTTGWNPVSSFTKFPEYRNTLMYHQLEAFVDWQYKFEIAKETYLMLYTGPTVQCGLAFTDKKEMREDVTGLNIHPESTRNRYADDDPDYILRRVNVTWGVGAGFQYKRYFIRGGYDFGIINPYKNRMYEKSLTDRYTRGRFDQWEIKIGAYIWYND